MPKNEISGILGPQNAHQTIDSETSQRSVLSDSEKSTLGSSTNTNSNTQTTITKNSSNRTAAALRFALQSKARQLMPDHRVSWCMRRFRSQVKRVGIVHAKSRGTAYFDGLMRCSRIWVCPVCAAKISETRRNELNELLLASRVVVWNDVRDQAQYYPGWHLTLLTFTIRHRQDESAKDVLARLDHIWKRFYSGRWAVGFRERFYVSGTLRALEMTHGEQGWHPHYHLLVFHHSFLRDDWPIPTGAHPSKPEMLGLARTRWSECAAKIGGYADPVIGVAMTTGEIVNYPIKGDAEKELQRWGMTAEATKQPSKRGRNGNRSITDLLIDAAKGDELAGELWKEAVAALEGHKQLQASMGLWLMLGRKPATEEEAAEDVAEPGDVVLASLNWEQWKIILEADKRGDVLAIAAAGDADALWRYLESIGVPHYELLP